VVLELLEERRAPAGDERFLPRKMRGGDYRSAFAFGVMTDGKGPDGGCSTG